MRPLLAFLFCSFAFAQSATVDSPDGRIRLKFDAPGNAPVTYSVTFNGKPVIAASRLGLDPQGQPLLGDVLNLIETKPGKVDETYNMPHGKANPLRSICNTVDLTLREPSGLQRSLGVEFRVFNDGVAFRYKVPSQPNVREMRIEKEITQFNLAKEGNSWSLQLEGYRTSYEDSYSALPVTSIKRDALVALPFLAEIPGSAWVGITEAHLENYSGMYLRRTQGRTFEAALAPRADDAALLVRALTPMESPWRVILIGDRPGALIESNIVLHLNPAPRFDAVWVTPGKTCWSWWSGDYAENVPFKPAMNTATMKHYIDFSAQAGLEYALIDEGWSAMVGGRALDLTRTNPELNLPELLDYAKAKGVKVWLWAHWTMVDLQMDQAFPLFEKWGVAGIKIDFMDRDDQTMVDFYHRCARKAAEHKLMVDFHGAYKPTGLRRYYPNVLTHEGVMGLEYLKWSARVTADHNTIIPFTRMLAGPLDYTPGGFNNVPWAEFTPRNLNPAVPTTRGHQLGLYVVFESAFQMLADHPEAYKGTKELAFLSAVPVTWDETRVLSGYPGEFVVIARRRGPDWFVGGVGNSEPRDVEVKLDFLDGAKFECELFADAPDAAVNAKNTMITKQAVAKGQSLRIKLAPAGGFAAIIKKR